MIKTLLTLLLAVGLAVPAFARMDMHEHIGGPGPEMCDMCDLHGGGEMMDDMMHNCLAHLDRMGLSEEQMKKVRPMHLEMKKKLIRYGADLKIARLELREIMEEKDFDLEKASAQVKKIEAMRTANHLEMLKAMKDIRSMLTDKQFDRMRSMMQMRMKGRMPSMMKMDKE